MPDPTAIDAWINPNPANPSDDQVTYLFPGLKERVTRGTSLPQLIDELDAAGVGHGVLCAGYSGPGDMDWVCRAIDQHPDRFSGSVVIDPHRGMEGVRFLERLVRDQGFKMVRFLAFESQIPYDHPYYFPFYAKAVELDIAVGVNVGIPGPKVPGKHQHPLALDEVCHYFPDLRIVMSHGGEPWADLCVKLMLKWDGLHYMTSAFAPKHIPQPIIDYLNSRGADKILWASDYPLLTFERCMREVAALPIRDEQRRAKFLRGNAERVILGSAAVSTA